MELGDNLSNIQNLKFLVGLDEQDLQAQLDEFTLPTKILTIYPKPNGRVVAWLLTQHKIFKVETKTKKKKE